MYSKSPVSLNFWILSLFFVNGPEVLCVKSGCIKRMLSLNLSPSNKNLSTISFISHINLLRPLKQKMTH